MFFQSLHFNGKGCNKQFANIPSDTEDLEFMLDRARHSQGSARREIGPVCAGRPSLRRPDQRKRPSVFGSGS